MVATATDTGEQDQAGCQPSEVTLMSPTSGVGVCAPSSREPPEPVIELPEVPGLSDGTPTMTVNGKQVAITVTATPETAYVIKKTPLPSGWVVTEDGSATVTQPGKVPPAGSPACRRPPADR